MKEHLHPAAETESRFRCIINHGQSDNLKILFDL